MEETVEGSGEKKEMIRAWQTFLGNEWDNKGESRGEGGNGLVVEARPVGTKYFYQERQGCKSAFVTTCCSATLLTYSSLALLECSLYADTY